jgi:hypothetical protein
MRRVASPRSHGPRSRCARLPSLSGWPRPRGQSAGCGASPRTRRRSTGTRQRPGSWPRPRGASGSRPARLSASRRTLSPRSSPRRRLLRPGCGSACTLRTPGGSSRRWLAAPRLAPRQAAGHPWGHRPRQGGEPCGARPPERSHDPARLCGGSRMAPPRALQEAPALSGPLAPSAHRRRTPCKACAVSHPLLPRAEATRRPAMRAPAGCTPGVVSGPRGGGKSTRMRQSAPRLNTAALQPPPGGKGPVPGLRLETRPPDTHALQRADS